MVCEVETSEPTRFLIKLFLFLLNGSIAQWQLRGTVNPLLRVRWFESIYSHIWNFGIAGAYVGLKNQRSVIRFPQVPLKDFVAQLVELFTFNEEVMGSSPIGITTQGSRGVRSISLRLGRRVRRFESCLPYTLEYSSIGQSTALIRRGLKVRVFLFQQSVSRGFVNPIAKTMTNTGQN